MERLGMATQVGVGHRVPRFVVPDLKGKLWTNADLLGKRSVLFCFASW
jgi:peroxiredoxin